MRVHHLSLMLFCYKLNFIGRKKLDAFLKDRLSITVANLRPPNRKNKKRTKKRAVERFEGEVDDIVKNMMMITEYDHLFHSKQRRDTFVKRIGKVSFNSQKKYIIQYGKSWEGVI